MESDPIRDAVDALAAIPADVVPTPARRPPKHVVAALLAHHGAQVTTHTYGVTEDVDGLPGWIERTAHHAVLAVDLESLGWTKAEYDDPNITE